MKWSKRLPSPAMALALGALMLSVGGNVTAAVLITSDDIQDNTIRSADIRDGAIKSVDVGNGSLTGTDINDGAIKSADIGNGSLSGTDIGNGSLSGADVGTGSLTGTKVANNSLTGEDIIESTLGKVPSAASATSAENADLLDGQEADDFVADVDSAGGDVSGAFSNLQIGPDGVGRAELAPDSVGRDELGLTRILGCCVISFFEYTVPANSCHVRPITFDGADLGEVLFTFPETADLGAGVYMRPTVVAHPGEAVIETCNGTGAPVAIPFGTFFRLRLLE